MTPTIPNPQFQKLSAYQGLGIVGARPSVLRQTGGSVRPANPAPHRDCMGVRVPGGGDDG
jgi:hypothetical protein